MNQCKLCNLEMKRTQLTNTSFEYYHCGNCLLKNYNYNDNSYYYIAKYSKLLHKKNNILSKEYYNIEGFNIQYHYLSQFKTNIYIKNPEKVLSFEDLIDFDFSCEEKVLNKINSILALL